MDNIIEYGIASALNHQQLAGYVNEQITNGWQPYGNVFLTNQYDQNFMHQPMVRYELKKEQFEMNTEQQTLELRYSDEDLAMFKSNIDEKLIKANKELDYLQDLIKKSDPEKNKMEYNQLQQMSVRQQAFIDHLNAALYRIEFKTYGICRTTGKLIDKNRLMAVPHATLSLEAKLAVNKNAPEVPVIDVPKKEKKKTAPKKEKQLDQIRYSDDDLRNFKTLISNKIDEATNELKYLQTVLYDRNKGIKVENYEDMTPAEVDRFITLQKDFIQLLEDALIRVKQKTFGIDENTHQLIPKDILLKQPHLKALPVPGIKAVEIKEPKCRICGCTENDCRQCIEKTGQPCHWIDTDLCSACEEDAMKESEEIQAHEETMEGEPALAIKIDEASATVLPITPSNNDNDMNFFTQLAQAGAQNVDITMRIMQKDNKLTVNIMPGSKSVTIKPILVTGTAIELDEEFFKTIAPGINEIKGIVHNMEAVKKDLQATATKPAPTPQFKAAVENKKPAHKPKPPAKKKEPGTVVKELLSKKPNENPSDEQVKTEEENDSEDTDSSGE